MSQKRPVPSARPMSAAAMRTRPLGEADLQHVERVLAEFAPEWSVELHGICAEEAGLVVLPEDGDDTMGPSFTISREDYGLRLDQLHWDEMTEIGVYASLSEALDSICMLLAVWSGVGLPPSVTIH